MATTTRRRTRNTQEKQRIYVLDTNVLMHDPTSLFRFEEHDVFLPLTVIEELDNNKKGNSEVARNSREATRNLKKVVKGPPTIEKGADGIASYALSVADKGASGILHIETRQLESADATMSLDRSKADNHILRAALYLKETRGSDNCEVILVTKDTMVSVKANAFGIMTQDYESDRVIDDADVLPSGIRELPLDFWDGVHINQTTFNGYEHQEIDAMSISKTLRNSIRVNEFVTLESEKKPFRARIISRSEKAIEFRSVLGHQQKKHDVFGIQARNDEQAFALDLLLDPEIDFITLLGPAGTGKTLLTLAAALEQVMEGKLYNQIIFTRATVPVGEDIGFLPGTEEEKMNPWMGALHDNLEVLMGDAEDEKQGVYAKGSKAAKDVTMEQFMRCIKIKSMNFMRGRTFLNKFLIVDEAQNLAPKQMKTLITRAGPGTKVVCMGNTAQIDTPYLTEGSSGLSYAVEHFRNGDESLPYGWPHYGHIILKQAVRSRLASQAEKVF